MPSNVHNEICRLDADRRKRKEFFNSFSIDGDDEFSIKSIHLPNKAKDIGKLVVSSVSLLQ